MAILKGHESAIRGKGGSSPLALLALGFIANAEHALAELEQAWTNVEPEHANLGYVWQVSVPSQFGRGVEL